MKVTFVKSTKTGGIGGIGPQGSAELEERQHFSSSCAQGNISFPSTTKIVAVSSLRIVILSIASPCGKNRLESFVVLFWSSAFRRLVLIIEPVRLKAELQTTA